MNEEQSFKAWCIVELFGHVTLAGYVSEQVIGGASFIRLDVPSLVEKLAVDHIATLLWIKREAPAGWCAEFERRLEIARDFISEMFEAYCPDCDGAGGHATGTNGDVCLDCGYVHDEPSPF